MSDSISREVVIGAVKRLSLGETDATRLAMRIGDYLKRVPSVQPESAELSGKVWDEWCTGCKEYDQERHCCPRFNRVIRTAIDDAQPEIVRCKDCKYFQTDKCYIHIERIWELKSDDYCSQGERREA